MYLIINGALSPQNYHYEKINGKRSIKKIQRKIH
jgi:hypothetical protein